MKLFRFVGPVVSIVVISTAMVISGQNQSNGSEPKPIEHMVSAPAWELQDLDGKTVKSSDFKGKVLILDFWATWCPPCRKEIPGFIDLQKKYQASGLTVVGVSVDHASPAAIKTFIEKAGINYPVLAADEKIVAAYGGIDGIPTTFIIDQAGHIVKQHVGFTDESEIEKEIKRLLKL